MKLFTHAITALILTATAFSANAIIAMRDPITVTNSDGSTLQIIKTGDEALHFTTTTDGYLVYEADGVFTYGRLNADGCVVSTGILARDAEARSASETINAQRLDQLDIAEIESRHDVMTRRMQSYMPFEPLNNNAIKRAPQSGMGLVSSTYPSKGSTKGLIVLVQYKDVSFTHPDPAQYFGDMINKPGFDEYGGTGSALDYFTEQSGGLFTPSFDVYGPVTLSGNRADYGGNSSSKGGSDVDPAGMVVQACQLLDSEVDFSQYDTDGDGLIDNVFVFYAGQGEASYGPAESIWPHSWDVRSPGYYVTLDGKTLGHYACTNEWEQSRPDGVGTFIHEFSHVMGLPDLYDTNGQSLVCTPGAYSVLDYGPYNNGGCTPPNYGAYEKNALNWVEPIEITGAETFNLQPISTGQFCLIPTDTSSEFFLLENRQLTGWDAYIPGHGMLIWHVDYNANTFSQNVVNNTQSHQYVDIEEANNTPNNANRNAMAGWPFPGTSAKTSFTATTTPAMVSWSGTAINLPITGIEESADGVITFDVDGGGVRLEAPKPVVVRHSATDRYFDISWPAVDRADDYLLTVYAKSESQEGELNIGFDDQVFPSGWSTNCTYWCNQANYCGNSAPGLYFTEDGQYLLSPVLPGDISSLNFYFQGVGTNMSSNFYVYFGDGNGSFSGLYYTLYGNSYGGIAELNSDNIGEGRRQIRFQLKKTSGDVVLDDIYIKYGLPDEVLPDYVATSTTGKTEMRVDKLKDEHDSYYFTVTAINDKQRSSASEPVFINLQDATGIEAIATDDDHAPARYFNLQGIEVSNPAPGQIYIRRQGNTTTKVIL
ncbi:MAG: M6 family metalloprotease domain-containing protein [Lachnoclostridium sp.]|nr:M6 family metalloprotease domain-containing protein [Lachnoclostridium sp.]